MYDHPGHESLFFTLIWFSQNLPNSIFRIICWVEFSLRKIPQQKHTHTPNTQKETLLLVMSVYETMLQRR